MQVSIDISGFDRKVSFAMDVTLLAMQLDCLDAVEMMLRSCAKHAAIRAEPEYYDHNKQAKRKIRQVLKLKKKCHQAGKEASRKFQFPGVPVLQRIESQEVKSEDEVEGSNSANEADSIASYGSVAAGQIQSPQQVMSPEASANASNANVQVLVTSASTSLASPEQGQLVTLTSCAKAQADQAGAQEADQQKAFADENQNKNDTMQQRTSAHSTHRATQFSFSRFLARLKDKSWKVAPDNSSSVSTCAANPGNSSGNNVEQSRFTPIVAQ
eukprot:TRINITY_DN28351_c1_g1_i1.p1 TRINITY_DN28351_c1_g1~~TRINITY_DN28351_c1_g1_i1.p1  ORF type:complete len:270 (-),score=66.55 TRINITY_DN28351_c1_g1_i1:96-905(-)